MPAVRKNPPANASQTIRDLATKGHSLVGIASHFGVSKDTLKNWLEKYPSLEDAFEIGKDAQRQALHQMLYEKAMAKGDSLAALSILNSLYGWRDPRKGSTVDVNVDVKVQNVMVVTDHGTDDQWAAKAAEHQRKLVMGADSPKTITVEAAPALPAPAPVPPWVPPALAAAPTWVPLAQTVTPALEPARPSSSVDWKRNS